MASELDKRIAKLEASAQGGFGACWIIMTNGSHDANGASVYTLTPGAHPFIPEGTDTTPAALSTWRERFDAYNAAGNFRVSGRLIAIGGAPGPASIASQSEAPTCH
jgi:hypothetical protein